MELFNNEIIKDIPGYEMKYGVTNHGRVWSYLSNKWLTPIANKRKNTKGEVVDTQTRYYVNLGRGTQNRFYIHRLVAENFLENPNSYKEVDHIDENASNNHVSNLRWVTREMNMHNNITQDRLKNNRGLLLEIIDLNSNEIYYGAQEVADKNGVCRETVLNHINNKVKKPKWAKTGRKKNSETGEIYS